MDEVARLTTVLDTSPLVQSANESSAALNKIAGSAATMASAMDRAAQMVKNAVQFMGMSFGLFQGAETIKQTIEIAARYQTLGVVLQTVGRNAGYTAGQLNGLAAGLAKAGITLQESRGGLVDMIQAHLKLGQAVELARVAQNAAVTANLNSSETFKRVVQGIESGNSEILQTIGLNVQWERGYQKLAATMGVSVDQLSEYQKSQARMNEVVEEGRTINGAYEASMETASKQMRSMERYAEDLKVRLGEAFQPVYTDIVFGFAKALQLAAEHTDVLLTALAALAARGGASTFAKLGVGVQNIAESAMNATGLVIGGLSGRDAEAAEQRIQAAQREIQFLTELAQVKGMDKEVTRMLAAQEAELAMAENMATSAAERATAAELARTAVMKTMNGLVALAGGWWNVAFIAAVSFFTYLETHTPASTHILSEHADVAERVAQRYERLNTAIDQALQKRGSAAGSLTHQDDIDKATGQLHASQYEGVRAAARDMWDAVELNPVNNIFNARSNARRMQASGELFSLAHQHQLGKTTQDQYEKQLEQFQQKYRDLPELIDPVRKALMGEATAHDVLQSLQATEIAQTKELADAKRDLANATDAVTEKVLRQFSNVQAQQSALATGGPLALQTVQARQQGRDAAESSFDAWKAKNLPADLQRLRLNSFVDANGTPISAHRQHVLATEYTNAEPGTPNFAGLFPEAQRNIQNATQYAQMYFSLGTSTALAQLDLSRQGEATQRAYERTGTGRQIGQQGQLLRALNAGASTADIKRLQAIFTGENAGYGLGDQVPQAEKDATAALATRMARVQEAVTLATARNNGITNAQIAIAGSNARILGYASGDTTAATDDNARVASLRLTYGSQLYGTKAGGPEEMMFRAQQENERVANFGKVVASATTNVGAQRTLTAASAGSRAEYERGKLALDAYNQSLGTSSDAVVQANNAKTLLVQLTAQEVEKEKQAANEYNRSANETLGNNQAMMGAMTQGVAATERMRITLAGVNAVRQQGALLSADEQAKLRANAEAVEASTIAMQKMQERAQDMVAPIKNAVSEIQQSFTSFFQSVLAGGQHTFRTMGAEIRDMLRKVVADFVGTKISTVIKDKIEDIYRDKHGMVGAGGTVGVSAGVGAGSLAAAAPFLMSNQSNGLGVAMSLGKSAMTLFGGGDNIALPNVPIDQLNQQAMQAAGIEGAAPAAGAGAMATAGAGLGMVSAGLSIGSTIGQMTNSPLVGALGGAAGGAATGAAIGAMGGPIGVGVGAIIGGVAGLAGGLLSAGHKSHDAARQMQEAHDQFNNAMQAYVATATRTNSEVGDAMLQNKAQTQQLIADANNTMSGKHKEAQRNAAIDQINAASAANSQRIVQDFWRGIDQQLGQVLGAPLQSTLAQLKLDYDSNMRSAQAAGASTEQLAKVQQLYNTQVDQATRANNLLLATSSESLQARKLEAQGRTYEAAQINMQVEQQKELNDAINQFGTSNPQYIEQLKQVQALERARGATALSDETRNGPAGFKVSSYAYEFSNLADQFTQQIQAAINNVATIANAQPDSPPLTINLPPGAIAIDGNQDPVDMATKLIQGLRQKAAAYAGPNVKLSDAINVM